MKAVSSFNRTALAFLYNLTIRINLISLITLVILPAFVPILAPLVALVREVAFLALAEDGPEL
jgi:hypothetical protein